MKHNRLWPKDETARQDFDWCEALIKIHSGSFYRAFRHLRPDKAKAVFAIYAFCRLADDAVDEHNDAIALQDLTDDLTAFERGVVPDEPYWRALKLTFDRFGLNTAPYHELLQGLTMDLQPKQPADMAQLERYCYLVAGTVGLMLCPLLAVDPDDEQVRATSVKLGHAMQLTNILRDVGTDFRIGRIYLPERLMQRYGVQPSDLSGSVMSAGLIALWEDLAARAESYYHEVEQNLDRYEIQAQLGVRLSLEYYRSILQACRKANYQLLDRRIVVPDSHKLILYWRARFKRKRNGSGRTCVPE